MPRLFCAVDVTMGGVVMVLECSLTDSRRGWRCGEALPEDVDGRRGSSNFWGG